MKFSLKNPLTKFLVTVLVFLVGWYLIYELWLHPTGIVDRWVIENLSVTSSWIMEVFGFETIPRHFSEDDIRVIGIDGTHGLWVGDPCNGIVLFALFSGFILAYPGPVKRKLWYIPLGLISIHLLNIMRIVSLCFIVRYAPDYLEFNHTYVFTALVYGYVFLLWYWWANKLSKTN